MDKHTKSLEKRKLLILFIIGFVIYITIEVVWTSINGRFVNIIGNGELALTGASSIWMGLLGGILFILLGLINEVDHIREKFPLAVQSLIGALIITALEFISGLILNVWLKLDIWDYTGYPLAGYFLNQINLYHSFMWFLLSPLAFWLDDTVRWIFYRLGGCSQSNGIYNFFWYLKHLFKLSPPNLSKK